MKIRIPLLVALLAVLVATGSPAAAARRPDLDPPAGGARLHRIVELEHDPLPAEREELARMGVEIVQPVAARRAVVRGSAAALAALAASGMVAAVEPIEPTDRLHVTAIRELVRHGGAARIEVVFHADVPIAEAVARIRAAGAWPVDALPLAFAPPRNVEVWASPAAAHALSGEDAVAVIHGPEGEIEAMNAVAASMSNVPPVHAAPYGLSGAGVTVGVIDVGWAQATHVEFDARVTATAPAGTSVAQHPTHVVGTIAAKGARPEAKGMAPAVTVHQWTHENTFLNDIDPKVAPLGLVAVNNSWGFITGWNYDDGKSRWAWYGNDLFGAYSSTSAGIDQLTRNRNVLFILAAGNDGNDNGPPTAPFAHVHPNDTDGEATWCISSDGSGTDCPATPCGGRCEKTAHPADGQWSNVNRVATSKNSIAVGAITESREPAAFSSRGPARDGRVKPDLVAKGVNQYSTLPPNAYGRQQGTSMATPVVTGIAALVVEQWRKTMGGDPGAGALKALLIHGAQDLGLPGPDYTYGFGLVDAKASVDTVIADGGRGTRIARGTIASGQGIDFLLDVPPGVSARVTLAWMDLETRPFPANEITLVNDLDLRVIGPGPSSFAPFVLHPEVYETEASIGANRRDSVEQIEFTPSVSGSWRATVRAAAVPGGGAQEFVLVSSVPIQSSRPSCADPYEPNDYPDEPWGRLRSGKSISTRLCGATDVDYYWFAPDASGTVTVTVAAAGPALRATLIAPNGAQSFTGVPAGGSAVLTSAYDATPGGARYLLKIEADASLATEAAYMVTTSFPSAAGSRGRTARR